MNPDDPNKSDMPDFSGVTGGASTTAKDSTGKPVEAIVYEDYVVVAGDSLSKIAKKKYGDAQLWKVIFDANTELIKNPDRIQIGWKLRIPPKPNTTA